ncbi:MAG: twin-arginine translocase TatA/TatE family subunit [Acidobacteria bacterium]|nr:twin-arginine translocase TatA/TatE family subunit [Acidobacteriota bacterium]
MFGGRISGSELIIILGVILLLFGTRKLPGLDSPPRSSERASRKEALPRTPSRPLRRRPIRGKNATSQRLVVSIAAS